MGLISYFRNRQPLSDYRSLRETGRHLNHALVGRLPKVAIMECAKKLGLRKGKSLVLDNEHAMAVLFDYCLYSYTRGGKNVIENSLENASPGETSEEMTLLRAMVKAHYSVFLVEQIEKGAGASLFDLLRHERLRLIDIGIGSTAVRGMFFAGRLLPLGEFYITSGAFVPLPPQLVERIVIPALEKFCGDARAEEAVVLSPVQEAAFSGQIIRAALKAGALDRIGYV
jgi:hypothetical protein